MFHNIDYSFQHRGKTVYVPTEKAKVIALHLRHILRDFQFDPFYRHLNGGHVGILHAHRSSAWFSTADIEGFFGNVPRNRVAAALKGAGVDRYAHMAKWSTVRGTSGYVLPYGFPASTLLATLVMQFSSLGTFLRGAARAVRVEVWLDDISLSSDDEGLLTEVYEGLLGAMAMSGWKPSARKSSGPARAVRLFNCELAHGASKVTDDRRSEFFAVERSGWAVERFEGYCRKVERGNK